MRGILRAAGEPELVPLGRIFRDGRRSEKRECQCRGRGAADQRRLCAVFGQPLSSGRASPAGNQSQSGARKLDSELERFRLRSSPPVASAGHFGLAGSRWSDGDCYPGIRARTFNLGVRLCGYRNAVVSNSPAAFRRPERSTVWFQHYLFVASCRLLLMQELQFAQNRPH